MDLLGLIEAPEEGLDAPGVTDVPDASLRDLRHVCPSAPQNGEQFAGAHIFWDRYSYFSLPSLFTRAAVSPPP